MSIFERHLFVCQNRRRPGHPKGCCGEKGAIEALDRLKQLAFEAGLKGRVRINSAGCLGLCATGLTVVVYPEAVWYGSVTPGDADEIFHEHVIHGRPVERLRIDAPSDR